MTDLEMTKLCAEAMGITGWLTGDDPMITDENGMFIDPYDPLNDDAQAMALVKKFQLLLCPKWYSSTIGDASGWRVMDCIGASATNSDLNRAIVECVAKMQSATR